MSGTGSESPLDGPLAERVQALRQRDGTTTGIPTFLLLEDASDPAKPGSPTGEGPALGRLAGEVLERLASAAPQNKHSYSPLQRDREVALALEVLADLWGFAPGAGPPSDVSSSGGDEEIEYANSQLAAGVAAAFAEGRYLRAVNFHATPRGLAGRLEAQLRWLARRFVSIDEEGLLRLMDGGGWPHDRPGVLLNFFNGYRDNREVAAPILQRLGLVGRFFVVAGWMAAPPGDQRGFARRHRIALPDGADHRGDDARLALSPEEVADLAGRGHAIASHTLTHASPYDSGLTRAGLESETAGPKLQLERLAGCPVRALAWHTGSPLGASPRADGAVGSAGYDLLFANHTVQRVRQDKSGT